MSLAWPRLTGQGVLRRAGSSWPAVLRAPHAGGLHADHSQGGAVSERPWMPMYWGDYLADTRHLTIEQHGAYLLLIAHYWQRGCLPTDPPTLKRILGLHGVDGENRWRSICLALAPFFQEGWRHKRIDAELQKADEIKTKRALAGQKGGRSNRGRNNWERQLDKANAKQTDAQPQSKKEGVAEKGLSGSAELRTIIEERGWVK